MGLKGKRVLMTCGPTWVPIDAMRVISNKSSGELGHRLALALKKSGARVTLLEGRVQYPLNEQGIRKVSFTYFTDLAALLNHETKKHYDIVIHAAAVSDYQCSRTNKGKISSCLPQLTLTLVPTEKLINRIKDQSPDSILVGFKLTTSLNETVLAKKCRPLFQEADCDLVVANVLSPGYRAQVRDRQQVLVRAGSRQLLTDKLITLLEMRT